MSVRNDGLEELRLAVSRLSSIVRAYNGLDFEFVIGCGHSTRRIPS